VADARKDHSAPIGRIVGRGRPIVAEHNFRLIGDSFVYLAEMPGSLRTASVPALQVSLTLRSQMLAAAMSHLESQARAFLAFLSSSISRDIV